MNVLFVTSWYPTSQHPVAGVFVREHAKAARERNDVRVLHCAGSDPALRSLWRLECESDIELTEGIETWRLWYRRLPIPRASYFVYLAGVLHTYRRFSARDFRPDVIHAHVYEAGVPAVVIGWLTRTPVILTEHTSDFPRQGTNRTQRAKARLAIGCAARALPVSSSLQRAIESHGISGRFQVVPNAVDLSIFHPRNGTPLDENRFLFVGLLSDTHVKGIPVLLEALARLRSRRGDWHFDIVGDGPARREYEAMARRLRLEVDLVSFLGPRPKAEVAKLMRESTVLVLPSLQENLPCVVLEAMASGLPVVATSTGGVPELVTPRTGILVPPGDAAALERALEDSLDRAGDFDRQAIAAEARSQFGLEAVGKELADLYAAVLREAGGQ